VTRPPFVEPNFAPSYQMKVDHNTIEEVTQIKCGKTQKFKSDATLRKYGHSEFSTSSSFDASGHEDSHARGGSISMTIKYLLKGFFMHVEYHSMFFALPPPIGIQGHPQCP
jgi:hypothetical protein